MNDRSLKSQGLPGAIVMPVRAGIFAERLLLTGIFIAAILLAAMHVQAAFPYDMEEKALMAKAVDPSEDADVIVLNDSELMDYKETVPADEFKIRIYKADGEALYGDYESGDGGGSGWISEDSVVFDPDFCSLRHLFAPFGQS